MSELFSFGAWVRQRRRALDLTREELAAQIGCSIVTIRHIEADERRPSKQLAARLAACLHLSAEECPAFLHAARGQLATDRLAAPGAGVERRIGAGLAPAERDTPALALPSGTVTFLFTDIEGSTRLWSQNPQTMGPAIIRHETLLRAVITATGGVVFKTVGDAIYAAFASALDAAQAAVDGQRAIAAEPWDTTTPLRVRMALHSGAVVERNGDYFGLPLSRIARLLAASHGGQILFSQTAQELVREQLAPELTLRHLGRYRLEDLTDPQHIFQLLAPHLPVDFPPLRLSTERAFDELPLALPPFLSAAPLPLGPPAPFVAREQELAELADALTTARSGAGQILFVIGGAGRGKTMLVQEFARQAQAADGELLVVSGYSNAHTGTGDPYLPFREALTMLSGDVETRWASGLISTEHARRLWEAMPLTLPALIEHAPDLLGTFVPSTGVRERAATFADRDAHWWGRLVTRESADAGARVTQQPIFAQYTAALSAIARERPLLLILEDLHWVDSASSGLLFHLSREAARSRMLIVGTYRPDEVAVSRGEVVHPLAEMVSELKRWHGDIWLDLGELAEADGRRFVEAYLDTQPNQLGSLFREALFKRTGGHALFTVELVREMRDRGDLRQDADGQWIESPAINWNTLPARVEGVIEKRIQRLERELRSILTIASVEGETFTAEVVARVQQVQERGLVQRLSQELDKQHRLVVAHILAWLGSQRLSLYRFRHQLFQQYVYHSLTEMERAYLHEAVGSVLEALYGQQSEQVAVQLARHFEQAGLPEKAVAYLLQAGRRAAQLSAYQEAIGHLTKGLTLLERLPDTPERAQTELELQIAQGTALRVTKGQGTAEVEQIYSRAWQLCQQIYAGETSRILPILYGWHGFYAARGDHRRAYQLAEEFLDLAQHQKDPTMIVAHRLMGHRLFLGELVAARPHFEQIAARYNPEQHRPLMFQYGPDPGSAGLSVGALDLWLLGYVEPARRWSERALMLAREADHAFTLAYALVLSSWFHQFCQERTVAQEYAEEAIAISTKQGIALFLAWGTIFRGWALAKQGQGDAGIVQLRQGVAALRAAGIQSFGTHHLTLLAEAYQTVGQPDAGLAALAEAAALVETTEERFWEAEIYRLKGELLLTLQGAGRSQGLTEGMQSAESPEGCFLTAIEIARRQEGKSLELRATVSLARLWRQHGKQDQARRMLAEIYGFFTKGFDTIDMRQANALLQELSA
jgi:class 3 adenylate cyclase/tetratricopeptide (TPR) repeat protein